MAEGEDFRRKSSRRVRRSSARRRMTLMKGGAYREAARGIVMSESSLFAAVLEKPVAERAAFLEGACRGDEELRRRIEALLKAHKEDDDLFEPAVSVRPTEAYRPISEEPGAVIGHYKLRQKIG